MVQVQQRSSPEGASAPSTPRVILLCRTCKNDLDIDLFSIKERQYRESYGHECRSCKKLRHADYYRRNILEIRDKTLTGHFLRKKLILDHYGRKCVCCEESNESFLTVDHINNDGSKQRKIYKNTYSYAVSNGFPVDLQILCYNCNMGKARNNGICPHKGVEIG